MAVMTTHLIINSWCLWLCFRTYAEALRPSETLQHRNTDELGQGLENREANASRLPDASGNWRHPEGNHALFQSQEISAPGDPDAAEPPADDKSPPHDISDQDLDVVEEVKDGTTTLEPLQKEVESIPKRRPFVTNFFLAGLRSSVADLLIQWSEFQHRRQSMPGTGDCSGGLDDGAQTQAFSLSNADWNRNRFFTCFGFLYDGVIAYLLEITLLTWLFPYSWEWAFESWSDKLVDRKGQQSLLLQVIWDNLIHYPCIYYPLFYALKGMFQDLGCFNSWVLFRDNICNDLLKGWMLWVPGDVVAYSVPIWLRMVIANFVGFIWAVVLSASHGAEKAHFADAAGERNEGDRAGG